MNYSTAASVLLRLRSHGFDRCLTAGGAGRWLERNAFFGRKISKRLVGERVLLGFFQLHSGHVHGVARDACSARRLGALFLDHGLQRSSVSPDPPMLLIIPEAISVNSAMAFFIFRSLMLDFRDSIFARALPTATSRAFSKSL